MMSAVIGTVLISLAISATTVILCKKYKRTKKKAIAIFTRYPTAGNTKTRLIPTLGQDGAAYSQLLMTNHIIERMKEYSYAHRDTDIEVWYSGGTKKTMEYWMTPKAKYQGSNIFLHEQPSGGLGEKLKVSTKSVFGANRDYLLIIGCDIPGISSDTLDSAFELLQNGADMVLGPAADGGYYLVGFSKSALLSLDRIFEDIDWGTEKVFLQQCEKANALGLNLQILKTVLSDVDTAEDIPVMEEALQTTVSQLINPTWSVVIPTLNEEDSVIKTLENTCQNCSKIQRIKEIVIADGGSKDKTLDLVTEFAKTSDIPVHIVISHPGRGFQLRAGASAASADFLLFLHSDCLLPKNYDIHAENCLKIPGNVAGAFKFNLDLNSEDGWFFNIKLKILINLTNRRVKKYELPYGDNAIFISHKMYDRIGGFQELYLLEDLLMVEELWKHGHIGLAECEPVVISARRWRKFGLIKTTGLNQLILIGHYCGVSPNTLAGWYYGDKLKAVVAADKKQS